MTTNINLNKNTRILSEWQPLLSIEDYGNDPVFNLSPGEIEKEVSTVSFFQEIAMTSNLLEESFHDSASRSTEKSSMECSATKSSAAEPSRDQKDAISSFARCKLLETMDDAVLEQQKPLLLTPSDKSITEPLRRSSRASTQKKTKETYDRIQSRPSSSAVSKLNEEKVPDFASPHLKPFSSENVLPSSLSAIEIFDSEVSLPLIASSLITTPQTVTSHALTPFHLVPGLDEWNQLFRSRPQMGVQFAIWEWMDLVRTTAFRYPSSLVQRETSRLDIWKNNTSSTSIGDMNNALVELRLEDVDEGMISFIDNILQEDEVDTVREKLDTQSCLSAKAFSPAHTCTEETNNLQRAEIDLVAVSTAFSEKENVDFSAPMRNLNYEKMETFEKAVSFRKILSPRSGNELTTQYRKTPHPAASQSITKKGASLISHVPKCSDVHNTGTHRRFKNHFDKCHYPTTPYVCDSPSTEIPDFWIQLFLNRPDPFESNTKEVLSWLSEVSRIIEKLEVFSVPQSSSSMPSVSSLNDTQISSNVEMMSPMFSPMSTTSFVSPPLSKAKDI